MLCRNVYPVWGVRTLGRKVLRFQDVYQATKDAIKEINH